MILLLSCVRHYSKHYWYCLLKSSKRSYKISIFIRPILLIRKVMYREIK